jgi:hypothetical protein
MPARHSRRLTRSDASFPGLRRCQAGPGVGHPEDPLRPSPRGSALLRPPRTPAARSASLPPSRARSGIKPTYGRCSRWGIVAFASSLDQAGPIARTVRDNAILLHSMAGHDPKDTTSADLPVPDFESAAARGVKGLRIGIPREYRLDGRPPRSRRSGLGARNGCGRPGPRSSRFPPHTKYALPPIILSLPPKPRPTSPAMTGFATAAAFLAGM